MELAVYTNRYDLADTICDFMDSYYSLNMKYLASDLLNEGMSPEQITDAVAVAIKIVTLSGLEAHEHFMPLYSAIDHEIIKDCKLSSLGYGLVLMNADENLSIVGDFQIRILNQFI
jgi:hypothetical protein